MSKMITAKSYQNGTIVKEFEKNGKPYATIKMTCPRCGGLGIIVSHVENGQPIPIPVDEGICYQCGGAKYITKDVRLYTEEEFNRMKKYAEIARAKKEVERKAKMEAEFETKRAEWLAKNGFTPDGYTYIYIGLDSYAIKDELKASGWHYDPVIRWHKADPADHKDNAIIRHIDEFFDASAWGEYRYKDGAKDIANKLFESVTPKVETEYYGAVGDKVKDVEVELIRKFSFQSRYGVTNVFNFMDDSKHLFVWFTSTIQPYEQGDHLIISSATIKDHKEYKDDKQTVITRARLKNIEEA